MVSHIHVPKSTYRIFINSPISKTIVSDGKYGSKEFRYKPDSIGTFIFSGTIEYDDNSVAFSYKYIVAEKR